MAQLVVGFILEAAVEYGVFGETAATLATGAVELGGAAGEAVGAVEAAVLTSEAVSTTGSALATTESIAIQGGRAIQGKVLARGAIAGGLGALAYKGKDAVTGIMIDGNGDALAHGDVKPKDIGNFYPGNDGGKRRKIDFEETFEETPKHFLGGLLPPSKRRKGERTPHKIVSIDEYNKIHHKKNPFFVPVVDYQEMTSMRKNNGIPYRRKVIHRFSTNRGSVTFDADATTNGFTCTANSIENPSGSGSITSNALLFDQMAAIYERYTVIKATIRIDGFNGNSTKGIVWGVSLKDDTTILTSTGHYAELGDTIYKTCSPLEHAQIVMTAQPVKYFGVKKSNAMADDRLSCATGSDARPSDALFFHLWAAPMEGSNASAAPKIEFYYTIQYEVIWTQPLDTARSTS